MLNQDIILVILTHTMHSKDDWSSFSRSLTARQRDFAVKKQGKQTRLWMSTQLDLSSARNWSPGVCVKHARSRFISRCEWEQTNVFTGVFR